MTSDSHCRPLQGIRLDLASGIDSELIWRCRNEPEARRNSFSTGYIPFEQHQGWFLIKLVDPREFFLIGKPTDLDKAIGYVRFTQLDEKAAEVSIALAAEYRGRGYGTILLEEAISWASSRLALEEIRARIKPTNAASIALFKRVGFRESFEPARAGNDTVCMTHDLSSVI